VPPYPERLRRLGNSEPERLDHFPAEDAADMRWIFHRHGLAPVSIVTDQVNVKSVALVKAKNHAPVATDTYAPESFQVAFS
jgi:hypothetical protein